MNYFLNASVELANQRDYLDQLFRVYPLMPDSVREVDSVKWSEFEKAFEGGKNEAVLEALLKFDLFAFKDSYVAYLRRDRSAIKRNPQTVARLCGRLKEMGLGEIYKQISSPKETNRQIGPLFRRFLQSGATGLPLLKFDDFVEFNGSAVLDESDAKMAEFASAFLGYKREKGLDLIARVGGKFVIGEAKFLTDFGGHQNAQLEDALALLEQNLSQNVVKVAILDGVCYIKGKNKLYTQICQCGESGKNIFSALLLREFLFSC